MVLRRELREKVQRVLRQRKLILIAEVQAEWKPPDQQSGKIWYDLLGFAATVGDLVLIDIDSCFQNISIARRYIDKLDPELQPSLAARIAHPYSPLAAFDAGANLVYTTPNMVISDEAEYIVEVHTLSELARIPPTYRIAWDARGAGKDSTACAREEISIDIVREKWRGWLCQTGPIQSLSEVHPKSNAVLVGYSLEKFVRSLIGNTPC